MKVILSITNSLPSGAIIFGVIATFIFLFVIPCAYYYKTGRHIVADVFKSKKAK